MGLDRGGLEESAEPATELGGLCYPRSRRVGLSYP